MMTLSSYTAKAQLSVEVCFNHARVRVGRVMATQQSDLMHTKLRIFVICEGWIVLQ